MLIQASPAGKRLINIDLLSGGEKTLTALAFLFALQRYKPAPFYILDEVDAALDKENTRRLGEFLQRVSKDAQFLVITHNDITVRYGDVVYGATLVDGETKLVGLEMPRA
jgi:chromosome segregation protein